MEFKFEVDTKEVRQVLKAFVKVYDKNMEVFMREEFVLLIKELIKLTPPKKRGPAVKKLDSDLRTLFRASQKMEFREEFLNKLKRKGGIKLAETLTKVDKENRRFIAESPTTSRHDRNRDKRGRVVRNPRFQVITKAGDFNKFKRKKAANIGRAKAGWIPKNNISGQTIKTSAWLSKNKSGIYRERISDNQIELSIHNTISYIVSLDKNLKIVERAIFNRQKKLIIKLKKQTRLLIKQQNLS